MASVAGMSTERTTVASMSSETAMPKPICWNITRSPAAKPQNTATMMSVTPVMIWAVEPHPEHHRAPGIGDLAVVLVAPAEPGTLDHSTGRRSGWSRSAPARRAGRRTSG
jgi:hypothetical protein